MRYTVAAVVLTPLIASLISTAFGFLTSMRQSLREHSRSGLDRLLDDLVVALVGSWFVYLVITLLVLLPIHLVLSRLGKRGPVPYAVSFMVVGVVVSVYLFRFLPPVEITVQAAGTIVLFALCGALFWAIAVLWPLSKQPRKV